MHLDPPSSAIVERAMLIGGDIEVGAELAIEPLESIPVEGRGHPRRDRRTPRAGGPRPSRDRHSPACRRRVASGSGPRGESARRRDDPSCRGCCRGTTRAASSGPTASRGFLEALEVGRLQGQHLHSRQRRETLPAVVESCRPTRRSARYLRKPAPATASSSTAGLAAASAPELHDVERPGQMRRQPLAGSSRAAGRRE